MAKEALVSLKLNIKDVEELTGQAVIDMRQRGKWIQFMLENGTRFSIPQWQS